MGRQSREITRQLEGRESMAEQTERRRHATGHTGHDAISIHFAKKQTIAHPLYFEVCVLVTQRGHRVGWSMDMLPEMRVPIQLDRDQQLILIAAEQELLVDSTGVDRRVPIQVLEEVHNETQEQEQKT